MGHPLVEASPERVLDHLRGPVPPRGDLLTEDAGNTVSEIDPRRSAIEGRDLIGGYVKDRVRA
jgi:hypothetical protein